MQVRLAKRKASDLEMRAQQAEANVVELNRSSQYWKTVAYNANSELQSVYKSTSWRVTLPLRKAMLIAKRIFDFLSSLSLTFQRIQMKAKKIWQKSFKHENNDSIFYHATHDGQRIIYYYVDHTVGFLGNTGVQHVVRGLAKSFKEKGEKLYFVKWNFNRRQLVLINRDELAQLSNWNGPKLNSEEMENYPTTGSPEVTIPEHLMIEKNWLVIPEVTHISNHPAPVTLELIMAAKRLCLKTAFVFYDATPLRRKELAGMALKHEKYMQQLLLADLIVPISKWSASDLMTFFTHHEFATSNIIPKIDALALPGESLMSARVTSNNRSTKKLILSVGSITPHKNQMTLVKAFEAFTQRHLDSGWELALVGSIHHEIVPELTDIVRKNPSIRLFNNIPDEELNLLFNDCAFTVFPSVLEGFGLPILESLWHGKPCICANFGAMAEVASDGGCLRVDVRDSEAILIAIERLVFQPDALSSLVKEAVTRPTRDWKEYGQDFGKLLDQVADPLNKIGVIYYFVDHTCTYRSNSGIQRIVRGLARALLEIGAQLIPVKWNKETNDFSSVTQEELVHLARWNGPPIDGWVSWQDPNTATVYDWLLVPELLVDPNGPIGDTIKGIASKYSLRTAWVFYDAIPWKAKDIYTEDEAERHGAYMKCLNKFELVLAISEFSRNDLLGFLQGLPEKTLNPEDRVKACILPGEFRESKRVLEVNAFQENAPIRILCVCTIEPRKNHLKLLEAFKELVNQIDKRIELCLVGGSPFPSLAKQVEQYIETVPGIRWERNADDNRLRTLYEECDFTVYPSIEEGFGLPILESLWHARPCICRSAGAMAEVGVGGGCLLVETNDVGSLTAAMMKLISDQTLRENLASEAIERPFRTWKNYAFDVIKLMAYERNIPIRQKFPEIFPPLQFKQEVINLSPRPLLSICISTYNRAAWLELSLKNLNQIIPIPMDEVEIVVCDNTSTDKTPDVVKPFMGRKDFRYYRNPRNVGMLGNLQITTQHANGRFVWILGDDDLLKQNAVERVLNLLREKPDLALVYLNYAWTREDNPNEVKDFERFLTESTPIVESSSDLSGSVRRICTESENFFTAIYCLIFRRDHALLAYSQNTTGRPFSTMLTCIPTTNHVLHNMMDEPAFWIGEPLLVVNLNVSWMRYASLWILERLPEVFDLAEKLGADSGLLDVFRTKHVIHIIHWFNHIYFNQTEPNFECFSLPRLISRFKHIQAFKDMVPRYKEIYGTARVNGAKGTDIPTEKIFEVFEVVEEKLGVSMDNYYEIENCRINKSKNLVSVINLGFQALTGVFPKSADQKVTVGPLELVWCPESGLLQLKHSYEPSEMYGDNYGYRSGLNQSMVNHLSDKVAYLERLFPLKAGDIVVDIGSNDCTTLKAYQTKDIQRIGIDPTANKFLQYYPKEVRVVPDFFSADVYKSVSTKPASIVSSIAMFYDLESPINFARQIESILAEDGVWHFEQSYMPSMLRTNSYDTICHEHLEYYSLGVVKTILETAGLRIVDVVMNAINGGSFAVTAAKSSNKSIKENNAVINWLLEQEERMGLKTPKPYRDFEERVFRHRDDLTRLIRSLNADGKKILGYGASTKGNVLLQFCGFTSSDISAIAEVNPEKYGCVTPGSHIPIISEAEAKALKPDYFLVLPWHFKDGIVRREKEFLAGGGRMIFPFPEIEII